jgi:hypothetical protein
VVWLIYVYGFLSSPPLLYVRSWIGGCLKEAPSVTQSSADEGRKRPIVIVIQTICGFMALISLSLSLPSFL